ncbi:response regulator [Paramaledivibacter caminithermalis]|jgi:two-component system response regulator YcbB|uniref:Stage 0 sporulation protein A homolog n=1 Tax=Paramaledivibacter caminithermalis (strain DSM 15212 / CIP 107654 / DViRD3) TaxID=1121301 RepID=A0A1M6SLF9_PARC5|nr:response regulator [Paramaledivibacter caminithermalis]SHK45476.1 two-component system, response regulator YcbB [Paramaledivibacter caminithermalis DSM 15212]
MKPSFYIVDDDPSIRRILSNIIDNYRLGYVIGEGEDGNKAIDEIEKMLPDIALVDLLLPSVDGIEIVKETKKKNLSTQFIMISEVNSKDMIGDAYKSGIEYFINKPINVIEVVAIIEKAIETLDLKKVLSVIGKTMEKNNYRILTDNMNNVTDNNIKEEITKIFSDIGILGESGSNDLMNIIEMIVNERKILGVKFHRYKVSDLYRKLNKKYKDENKPVVSIKAIEQRVRRVIQSSLENLASLGIEDYGNIKFEKYSTSLFDFTEVKRQMDYIRNKSQYKGKINVRKFIEGLISHISV